MCCRFWVYPCVFLSLYSASANCEPEKVQTVALSLINEAEYATLISVGKSGFPRARTVKFSHPNNDFVIWIATKSNTRKVIEVRANPKVHVHFIADEYKSYLSLIGTASIHTDAKTIQQHDFFEPKLKAKLWPNFPKEYVLIKIEPLMIEVLGQHVHPERVSWRPQRLCLQPNVDDVCR